MALSDEKIHIDTPENVIFGYNVAGMGSRFLAGLIDMLLIMLLMAAANIALYMIIRSLDVSAWGLMGNWLWAIFGLLTFLIFWGYYIFFEMVWNGQSPGKRKLGLRVIRADGSPVSFTESLVRNFIRLIDFLPAYYGIGVMTMFINKQTRRLGDLAAGTLVVHDRTVTLDSLGRATNWELESWTSFPRPAAAGQYPVERLTLQDLQLVESFLLRRKQLANRAALASQIYQTMCDHMGVPVDGSLNFLQAEDVLVGMLKEKTNHNPMKAE
jgi:uncharacterized RDD family membrane protein YckC